MTKKIDNKLMLLLGFFSTIQVFEFFNVTIFTTLLIIIAVYFLVTKRIKVKGNSIFLVFIFVSLVTTVLTFINNDFDSRYQLNSINGFINYALVFLIYMLINGSSQTDSFLKGFKISCYIQVFWALVQFITSEFWCLDFNKIVFNDLLKMDGAYSTYRDGKAVCSGLHWHPANLIPVIVYLFLFNKSIILKVICIVVTYYTSSATMYIALALCLVFSLCKFFKNLLKDGIKFGPKQMLILLLTIITLIFSSSFIFDKVINALTMLITRILQINSTIGGTSSAVHFSYYKSLSDIYLKNTLISKLFGVGIASSGIFFSKYYGQYNNILWVVESDFVNILLSQGIIGFILFYYIIISKSLRTRKYNINVLLFIVILLICGITYNLQFYWVILLELILCKHYSSIRMNQIKEGEHVTVDNNSNLSS